MRQGLRKLFPLVGCLAMSGCAGGFFSHPPAPQEQVQLVDRAIQELPEVPTDQPGLKRQFFTTIHVAGHRVTAVGVLDYHNPRDFRITAVTEMGAVLFDARMNWAGVTVLRRASEVDAKWVAVLVRDLERSFDPPYSLAGMTTEDGELLLQRRQADDRRYTWTFDEHTGRPQTQRVDLGAFDTLEIQYLRYNAQGWPEEMELTRKSKGYTLKFSFTDSDMAQRAWNGNNQ